MIDYIVGCFLTVLILWMLPFIIYVSAKLGSYGWLKGMELYHKDKQERVQRGKESEGPGETSGQCPTEGN